MMGSPYLIIFILLYYHTMNDSFFQSFFDICYQKFIFLWDKKIAVARWFYFVTALYLWDGRKIVQIGQTEPEGVTRNGTMSQIATLLAEPP